MQSHVRVPNGLLIRDGKIFAPFLIYYTKPFLIYDFASDPIWSSLLYDENFLFFFIFAGWSNKNWTSLVEIVNTFHLVGPEEKPTFQRGFRHVVRLDDIRGRSRSRRTWDQKKRKSQKKVTQSDLICQNCKFTFLYSIFLKVVWNYLYIRLTFYKNLILIKITFRKKNFITCTNCLPLYCMYKMCLRTCIKDSTWSILNTW